jgi:predicted DNA-binding protein
VTPDLAHSSQESTAQGGQVARFVRRVAFHEEPEVLQRLEELAHDNGRSLAAELRGAIRYWLDCHQEDR